MRDKRRQSALPTLRLRQRPRGRHTRNGAYERLYTQLVRSRALNDLAEARQLVHSTLADTDWYAPEDITDDEVADLTQKIRDMERENFELQGDVQRIRDENIRLYAELVAREASSSQNQSGPLQPQSIKGNDDATAQHASGGSNGSDQ
ncbi:hypothetical protein EXIGLDRAFT_765622 [Exidia glandulosa HHB12029]|uniref:Uncharacterized protein n=1 Tax=Exidia glandulosa HHB12029 TaxID=1314781 RepID=A0A165KBE8_EXIGL|nr:hypothetical protein EXIGLDRAFT_765622 [Exidia glandulosa HHB12029]